MATLRRWRPPCRVSVPAVIAAVVVALFVCTGGALWALKGRLAKSSPDSSAILPEPVDGVGALGRLEPGWKILQIAPGSSADGTRVATLAVEEGDLVQAGTVLAVLDTHACRQAALDEANAQVAISRARLALVKAGTKPEEIAAQEALIAKHRAALEFAEAGLQRAQQLVSRNALSAEEYEQRTMNLTSYQASLHQAEKAITAMKVVRPEEVAVAEAELMKASSSVERAEAELETAQIVSPIIGRVLKIHARVGERIGESGMMEIGDTDSMHAVAEVYERDVPRIKIGQRAKVKVQSLPGDLQGEVVRVGWRVGRRDVLDNDPLKDTDARVVEVRIKLDSASSDRVSGLCFARVEVHIDAPPLPEGD